MLLVEEQCKQNCQILAEGMLKFSNTCKSYFNIDPFCYWIIKDMSFDLFCGAYYDDEENPIGKTSSEESNFINKVFYEKDLIIHNEKKLVNGYHYRSDSLYPYFMSFCPLPIGIPLKKIQTTDYITLKDFPEYFDDKCRFYYDFDYHLSSASLEVVTKENEFFGFLDVELENPNNLNLNLYRPLSNIDENSISGSNKTIRGILFSGELIYLLSLGIKLTKINRYIYFSNSVTIFDSFIKKYEENKENKSLTVTKNILFNALYNYFKLKGCKFDTVLLKNSENYKEYIEKNEVIKSEKIGNKYLVTSRKSMEEKMYNDLNESTHIAAAIASYARIYMHIITSNPELGLYYSDSKSIFCQNPLPEHLVSETELGKFKLIGEVEEAEVLNSKVSVKYKK
jgi:hypothetical protein